MSLKHQNYGFLAKATAYLFVICLPLMALQAQAQDPIFNLNGLTLQQALGVKADSTEAQIKKAYRRLAARYHPESSQEPNEEIFKIISVAYEVLKGKNRNYQPWDKIKIVSNQGRSSFVIEPGLKPFVFQEFTTSAPQAQEKPWTEFTAEDMFTPEPSPEPQPEVTKKPMPNYQNSRGDFYNQKGELYSPSFCKSIIDLII